MKTDHISYGIIPTYKKEKEIFVCCIQNKKSNEWGLLKGTPESGETPIKTATRELQEETGITEFKIIGGKTLSEKYSFEEDGVLHNKTNIYFIASVDKMFEKPSNIDSKDMIWINIKDAGDFFKFENIKNVLKEVIEYLNNFPLINKYHGQSGEDYIFEYYEANSLDHLPKEQLSQVVIMAFHKEKLLIVNNTEKPGYYSPVGGGIEPGETPEECLPRELQEESNMKVIESQLIGYQKCTNLSNSEEAEEYQLRYFARVEPIGPFTPNCDPDGDVTELLEIDPKDYKKYFDWGNTGDSIMKKALKLLKE